MSRKVWEAGEDEVLRQERAKGRGYIQRAAARLPGRNYNAIVTRIHHLKVSGLLAGVPADPSTIVKRPSRAKPRPAPAPPRPPAPPARVRQPGENIPHFLRDVFADRGWA